jgi:argonaute-like protein implicated in RNA metabolism and viral defense
LQLGSRDVLLWTQGNVPMAREKDFYKEGKGIPSPILLSRFAGHGSLDELCRDVLGLSKMNWNNYGLYDRLPVTMSYAKVLAQTVKRMPQLQSRPYQFRFLM